MENVKSTYKAGKITIVIPVSSIIKECSNEDWLASHAIQPIKKGKESKEQLAEYIANALDEPSVDLGVGYVTPIENMIMDIISEAACDGEDFFVDEFDEDED